MLERIFDPKTRRLHIDGSTIKFREDASLILVSIDPRTKGYLLNKDIRFLGKADMKEVCPAVHDFQFRTYEYIPSVQDFETWYKQAKKDHKLFKEPEFSGCPSKMNGKYLSSERFLQMLPLEKLIHLRSFDPRMKYGMYYYWDDEISIK